MSPAESPPSSPARRRPLAVDGVLLGMTLLLAVVLNPSVQGAVASVLAPAAGTSVPPVPGVHTVTTGGLAPMIGAIGVTGGARGGPVHLSATLDRTSVLVGQDGEVRAELVIEADTIASAAVRKDTDLVVILDRSGSMEGDKIEFAKEAVRTLIGQLGPSDRFSLVTYSDGAQEYIPFAPASVLARRDWLAAVGQITADGYTNMSAGMDRGLDLIEAQRMPGRTARAVLISDGLPNLGDPTPEGLIRRAARAPRGEYVMTAVGVGADFNEFLMTRLADAGTGNYHFLADGGNLAGVFANELSTARETVASGVAVHVAPASGVRVLDASGYPLETNADGSVTFRPGILFSGQQRRVWVTFQVRADSVGERSLGGISLEYSRDGVRQTIALSQVPAVTAVRDEATYYSSIDKDHWERSVVTEEWNAVKRKVSEAVSGGRKEDAKGYLREYRAKNETMNAEVKSAVVEDNFSAVQALDAEVDEAFEGENQPAKQNTFSKATSADAYNDRRVGQVKK